MTLSLKQKVFIRIFVTCAKSIYIISRSLYIQSRAIQDKHCAVIPATQVINVRNTRKILCIIKLELFVLLLCQLGVMNTHGSQFHLFEHKDGTRESLLICLYRP